MKALLTGGGGQDGQLLSALLVENGFTVLKLVRPTNVRSEKQSLGLDICDPASIAAVIKSYRPDHVYHLAACHNSSESGSEKLNEDEMLRTNFLSTEVMLNAINIHHRAARFIFAGSSQMYTREKGVRFTVTEKTAENPATFYGLTKKWSRDLITHYRDKRNLYASTAVLFNHESCLRKETFLSRKISIGVAKAKLGNMARLQIQNDLAEADWSDAKDITKGLHLALLGSDPSDYVFASGMSISVRCLLKHAYAQFNLDWEEFVSVRSSTFSGSIVGDASLAKRSLNWLPQRDIFGVLEEMVLADIQKYRGESS